MLNRAWLWKRSDEMPEDLNFSDFPNYCVERAPVSHVSPWQPTAKQCARGTPSGFEWGEYWGHAGEKKTRLLKAFLFYFFFLLWGTRKYIASECLISW